MHTCIQLSCSCLVCVFVSGAACFSPGCLSVCLYVCMYVHVVELAPRVSERERLPAGASLQAEAAPQEAFQPHPHPRFC